MALINPIIKHLKFFLGTFIIPYLLMVLFVAVPMYYIEVALGQFCGVSNVDAFNCVPIMKGKL